jgi:LytS/YehU family sensor histidine kinase
MMIGVSLATFVRHLNLPSRAERIALPCVILFNLVIGLWGVDWYEHFYRAELTMRGMSNLTTQSGVRDIIYRGVIVTMMLFLCGLISLVTYFVDQQRWRAYLTDIELRTAREQRDLADSRLTVLQAQVEPHFLYNTMASVRSLIRGEPERAEATIDALVDHLRSTLPKIREGSAASSKLGDQLEICRSYLDVMRVRMGSRFRYSIEAPAELANFSFPPLMLISLVENAIKHGVEQKPGSCHIVIQVQRLMTSGGDTIEVAVTDDGVGLSEGPSGGLGLDNIRARLQALYGDRASLKLEGRDPGVTATLRVPLERAA